MESPRRRQAVPSRKSKLGGGARGGEVGEETEGTTMFTVSKRIYSESFVYCTLPAPETFTDQCNCAVKPKVHSQYPKYHNPEQHEDVRDSRK